jgi:hypothetical protein
MGVLQGRPTVVVDDLPLEAKPIISVGDERQTPAQKIPEGVPVERFLL